MCGIAGVFGACASQILERMARKIAHRGPDNLSTLSVEPVHLAHTRLSIIDLSPRSNQPLWDIKQEVCIVFNGEIYNYKVLQEELIDLGYAFHSNGDAEVIVNLYLHYGESFLEKLNGIFAFAIWDTRSSTLFLARDPFGVKPLYYVQTDDAFYFASEIKSLLAHPSVPRTLNYDALFRSVVFLWSPGPETVLKDVFKLEPGHYLLVRNRKIIQKVQYADWPKYRPRRESIGACTEAIDRALTASVEEQLISDVPVGSFLSGGVDSSLIVAMAKKLDLKKIECFTIDVGNTKEKKEGFLDDLPYAKAVADKLGVALNIVKTNPDPSKLAWMIYHLDEPQADPAPLNVSLICEKARKKGIKVLFSGAGGDDIFSGYRRHNVIRREKLWTWLPVTIRRILQKSTGKLPKKQPTLRRLAKLFSHVAESKDARLLSYFYWIRPDVVRGLFTEKVREQLSSNPMQNILDELKNRPEKGSLEKMLYLERRYFLVDHNLNYTDKMSMAHGVEVRVPFLDGRVGQCAAGIKASFKQRGYQGKWILKKMAERYLPKSIIYRSKSGFGAPLRQWLQHDLKDVVDDILGKESLERRGIFQYEAVQALIEADRRGEEDYAYSIFALLCREMLVKI